ncbi:hypothetical protein [Spirosoma sp.]|uniref:hypothetical protein n=1 Tax=Spirosoma sp. TaxID=1899569 RepID=UPI0026138CD8|nr:hypothetical protein [Spirosoma sp.]MCX6218327.1 hypothetical protein [Spirosoma sp.]
MEKLQTQLTFFLWNRNVVGWIWVVKRMMIALTIDQLFQGSERGALFFIALREGLSAITDYAQAKNPVISTNQSSPPNSTEQGVQTLTPTNEKGPDI